MTSAIAPQGVKSIEALGRGLDVLLAVERSAAVSLAELHRQTRIPKATLLRILKTLQQRGWIEKNQLEGRYVPSGAPGASGAVAEWRTRLAALAAPPRAWLQKRMPWPGDLAVLDGTAMLILDSHRPVQGLTGNYRALGFRSNMVVSALGRCYLAFCPEHERVQILRELARSTSELDRAARRPEAIRRLVTHARQLGYALRDPSGTSPDSPQRFGALAVPIHLDNRVVACLSIAWLPAVVAEQDIVSAHLIDLKTAARAIEERLRGARFSAMAQG
jgi:IclR family mhp operon transcriptional activator